MSSHLNLKDGRVTITSTTFFKRSQFFLKTFSYARISSCFAPTRSQKRLFRRKVLNPLFNYENVYCSFKSLMFERVANFWVSFCRSTVSHNTWVKEGIGFKEERLNGKTFTAVWQIIFQTSNISFSCQKHKHKLPA